MDTIEGVLERITFRNPENGYTIARVKSGHELFTAVGIFSHVPVGAYIEAQGEWHIDPQYGHQFKCTHITERPPATQAGLEKYLGSGLIKGIGPAFAKRLLATFGDDTLDVLDNRPERLQEVPGLGAKKIAQVTQAWEAQRSIKHIQLFLQTHDVPPSFGVRIYETYGADSVAILREDPYRLCQDIWGIGFKTADQIARKLGLPEDSPARQRAGLLTALRQAAENGHCFLTQDKLLATAQEALDGISVTQARLASQFDMMQQAGQLVLDEDRCYLPSLFQCESGSANRLTALLQTPSPYAGQDIQGMALQAEKTLGVTFENSQRRGMMTAWRSKVSVLTGGPGTGKTFTTRGILQGFAQWHARILLAAPTGRAAKRLTETTGREATTLHRMLGYRPGGGYMYNAEKSLECDVLLIDEVSMVDVVLFYHVLAALPAQAVLVLVGDADQLPSVGPGNVLHDLLPVLPVTRLQTVFRQAARSLIITNAYRIHRGEMPIWQGEQRDCFWVDAADGQATADAVVDLCARRLPGYLQADPLTDIQVLCPMWRGPAGAHALNTRLQTALNPQGAPQPGGNGRFRAGDRVMQLRNNYDKDVFNGDLGRVTQGVEDLLTVSFDGRLVSYAANELDELSTAYAITIHKSQGSEYPVVVAPMTTQHYIMLQRNLLYTCVTRAKSALVLVGSMKALRMAVERADAISRNTALTQRLERFINMK